MEVLHPEWPFLMTLPHPATARGGSSLVLLMEMYLFTLTSCFARLCLGNLNI